jgi:hypothetical protein
MYLHSEQGLKEQLWKLGCHRLVERWHFERRVGLERGRDGYRTGKAVCKEATTCTVV